MKPLTYIRLTTGVFFATAASTLAAPANDNFTNAIALTGDSGVHTGPPAIGATYETDEPDLHGYVGPTTWYKWTCTHDGILSVSTAGTLNTNGVDWDAAVDIYDGGPAIGDLNDLQFSDNGQSETFDQAVSAGTTYYIRMGWGGGPTADAATEQDAPTVVVTWSFALPPALKANAGPDAAIAATAPSAQIGGSPTARYGSGPYTYSWSPSTGLSDPTVANPIASPSATTTYTVTVTDATSAVSTDSATVLYMTPDSLISVDFIYSDLLNRGPSLPYSGDTILTGVLNNNFDGLLYAGQVGPWNALNVGPNNSSTNSASLTALKNAGGTATQVSFKMGRATSAGVNGGGWRPGYVASSGGNLREEQTYLYYPTLTSNHFNWELTGLIPNGHYRLTLFGNGGPAFTNTANSVPGVLDSEGDWNWADIVADAAGTILGDFLDTSANDDVRLLYGLQIYTLGAALSAYETWAVLHADGGTPSEDYNHDGVSNGIAYFMGATGRATNPGVVNGKVNWPHVGTVASFAVQVSTDLATWTSANPADIDTTSSPGHVIFTLPTGATRKFCRLVVTP